MSHETRRGVLKLLGGAALAVGGTGLAAAADGTASITFEDQDATGATVNVASVTVPDGGWVVLHDPGQNLDVIGHSVNLDAGTHEDVKVAIRRGMVEKDRRRMDRKLLAMAHRDTGIEGKYEFPQADPPYLKNGGPVIDTGDVTF